MKKGITELWSAEQLQTAVANVAAQINEEYEGERIILIGILKGATVFLADLMRHITLDVKIDFIGCTSYADGKHAGKVLLTKKWEYDLDRCHVILVDDIYDTGGTMKEIRDRITAEHYPKSIKYCTLVRRKDETVPKPHFYALEAEKGDWIYGYGLDNAQYSRNLPSIYRVDYD